MLSYDIIIKPYLSEKCYEGIPDKKYMFRVHPDATKPQIKKAVEEIFGVKVKKVNVINVEGKVKRRGRTEGKRASIKKAFVYLTDDSKAIEFFNSMA